MKLRTTALPLAALLMVSPALASSDQPGSPIDAACIAEQQQLAEAARAESGSTLCTILGVGRDMARAKAGKIPNVGGLGQGIISYVFQKFFPGCSTGGGPPSYFAEVYEAIRSIMRKELDQDTKQAVNAAARNVLNALDHEYYPRKKCADLANPHHRQDLSALLHKYDQTFLSGPSGMLGRLEANPQLGLDAYVIGAGVRLTIYQELALVDPFRAAPNEWCRSSYGLPKTGTVAKFSDHASKFAVQAYREIETARRRAIGSRGGQLINQPRIADPFAPNRNNSVCDYMPRQMNPHYMCCIEWSAWRGGRQPRCQANTGAWIEQGINGYFQQVVIGELRQQLHDPVGTAEIWKELIDAPVPLQCITP